MHEVSVISDLVSAVLKELEKYNSVKVEEVTLVIGEMTNLGEEQMEFAYEIVTKGTELEGSKLVIEHEKIIVKCLECDYKGGIRMLKNDYGEHDIPVIACPKCNGRVKIITGQACMVKNFKILETNECSS